MKAPAPELLEVELLTDADERRPMGTARLEYETERLRTATDSGRPMPASEIEELLADLRRIEAEAEEARADELETHNFA